MKATGVRKKRQEMKHDADFSVFARDSNLQKDSSKNLEDRVVPSSPFKKKDRDSMKNQRKRRFAFKDNSY